MYVLYMYIRIQAYSGKGKWKSFIRKKYKKYHTLNSEPYNSGSQNARKTLLGKQTINEMPDQDQDFNIGYKL